MRAAVSASRSFAEALRRLGLGPSGGNWRTLQRRCREWAIATDHFDPYASSRGRRGQVPLEAVLVAGSTYSRWHLKRRLFEQGLKERRCELCGQGEVWHGRPMALIIDHINGTRDDHRLENLRIVCPNCAATLDTHCGRRNRLRPRPCEACRREFAPRSAAQRFCSRPCAAQRERPRGPRPDLRKVERPPYDGAARRAPRNELDGRGAPLRRVGQRCAKVGEGLRRRSTFGQRAVDRSRAAGLASTPWSPLPRS